MTAVLGLSAYYHDSAACLVRDGEVVAAAQEERFTRRKGDAAFPARAAAYCLAAGGVGLEDLAAVAGASSRTLARLFRAETGLSFRQWRQQARMTEAMGALTTGASPARAAAIAADPDKRACAAASARMNKKGGPRTPRNAAAAPGQPRRCCPM